ncbi:hypothetical protein RFI_34770, partial [Reticulomyxa filosa]
DLHSELLKICKELFVIHKKKLYKLNIKLQIILMSKLKLQYLKKKKEGKSEINYFFLLLSSFFFSKHLKKKLDGKYPFHLGKRMKKQLKNLENMKNKKIANRKITCLTALNIEGKIDEKKD